MNGARQIVEQFYASLATGDSAGALGLLHPDIEWTEAERTPYYIGTMRGVNAVISGLLVPLGRDFESFKTIPQEFITEKDRVIVLGNYSGVAKISGRIMQAPFVHSWNVSNGLLSRFRQYTDSAPWNEALALRRGA